MKKVKTSSDTPNKSPAKAPTEKKVVRGQQVENMPHSDGGFCEYSFGHIQSIVYDLNEILRDLSFRRLFLSKVSGQVLIDYAQKQTAFLNEVFEGSRPDMKQLIFKVQLEKPKSESEEPLNDQKGKL